MFSNTFFIGGKKDEKSRCQRNKNNNTAYHKRYRNIYMGTFFSQANENVRRKARKNSKKKKPFDNEAFSSQNIYDGFKKCHVE